MSNNLSQNLIPDESVVSKINASGRPTDNNEIVNGDKNQNQNEKEIIELNSYRFIIVIIFFFLNFINGVHWVTFASCAAKFGKFYHLNHYMVDAFSLLFMFLYPFGCIPEAYIIDNVSMQIGLTISALCLIIGAGLKIFINTSIVFAYIGQFLTAIFQPAILNSPGKIAATWFNEKKRTLVTSICCVSNTIGVMFGYIFHVFFIEENTVNPKIWKDSFQFYLFMEFIITLILCLMFMALMRNKPKYPPSKSQKKKKILSLKEGLQSLKKNTNFIKVLISLTCIVGFINIFGTIFNSYMALYKIKDSSATYTAATANLVGILAALIVGHIIDKSKKYKYAMLICNIISLCTFIVTLILMETINQKYLSIVSFICYTLIIGFSVPIYTSGMDFVCEITYPVGESISEGVIMTFNQIMGVIGILICDSFRLYLKKYKFLTNLFCIILFIISCVTLLFVNPELKRNNKDRKSQIDSENDNKKDEDEEENKNLIKEDDDEEENKNLNKEEDD